MGQRMTIWKQEIKHSGEKQASPCPGEIFDNSPTFQRWELPSTANKSRRDG